MEENKNQNSETPKGVGVKTEVSKPFVGQRVKDKDGNIGIIRAVEMPHNILVEYDNGGSGVHCLLPDCNEMIGSVKVCYYDPLYEAC